PLAVLVTIPGVLLPLTYDDFVPRPAPLELTLFPYTTLFRSPSGAAERAASRSCSLPATGAASSSLSRTGSTPSLFQPSVAASTADRKSTRLNSSHEWISYAVFCLKKKNRNKR